jgi:hypothetical protein
MSVFDNLVFGDEHTDHHKCARIVEY